MPSTFNSYNSTEPKDEKSSVKAAKAAIIQ